MANPFKNGASDSNNNPNVRVVTNKNFFGKRNGGYDEKREFLAWGELSRDEDVANVSKFINVARAGYPFIQTTTEKYDKGGNPYKFLTYLNPNRDRDGIKLVMTGPWKRIFDDYQKNLIKIDFTLDELVQEARNES